MLEELCKIISFMNLNFLIKKIPAFCLFVRFGVLVFSFWGFLVATTLLGKLWWTLGALPIRNPLPEFNLNSFSSCLYHFSSSAAVGFQFFSSCSTQYLRMNIFLMSPSEMTASSPYSLNCSEMMNSY